ncbi:FFLEELY motif protein [Psychrobacter sp. CAL346-MNA-CIBAN-0220]|uniref:FFLEELY motif protein n=1 Tax=Psychrobacter sp. CAL346-MNA-CIBAN-0220 TaxID=3140457 RepID=UPI00332550A4
MSALSELQNHLKRFWSLPYHQDAELSARLSEVQTWQRARIQRTHSEVFEQPKNQLMADYFLTQLYGGDEFKLLAEQLARILPKAKKLERLAKESALETGSMAIQAAILAIELDLHLAEWLMAQDLPVNEDTMLAAYRAVNEDDERRAQIGNLKEVCYRTDKYINSFFLQKAFALAKGTAYRHNYQPLYDFIDSGFIAMRPLDSVSGFIDPFCALELMIIDQVHASDNDGKTEVFGVS